MHVSNLGWILFIALIIGLLLLDLLVFHRKSHFISVKEALLWSGIWISIALLFNAWVYFHAGHDMGLKFFTGYLVEKSLSVDNLFVFLLIFAYFQVPSSYQYKVLFWGIFGALVMRGLFIFAGIALIQKFSWLLYLLGGVLIFSGVKFAFEDEKEVNPEKNPALRLFRKWVPITSNYEGDRFLLKKNGKWLATPLLVVLIVVETTDLIFAVDSVPAVIAVSLDPFIVFSSNVLAILGLRALYFALAGMMRLFHYLHYGLSAILVFIGGKMILHNFFPIPLWFTLAFIALSLTLAVTASFIWPEPEEKVIPVVAEPPSLLEE